jgi:putative ABC transport system permease protein
MRDIFFDLSVRSVKLNYLRSLLASIGIVIGVDAISSMGMLGTNMQLQVKDQLSQGANTIVITTDTVRLGLPGSTPATSSSNTITKNQLIKIRQAAGIDNTVIPLYRTSTQFTLGSVNGRSSIYGIAPSDITDFLTIDNGTNIQWTNDALVGATIASNFNLKIGDRIHIGQSNGSVSLPVVHIVGILKARGMTSDSVNADNAIIVSRDWYTAHYGGEEQYPQVNVIVKNIDTLNAVETAISTKLNTNPKTPVIR